MIIPVTVRLEVILTTIWFHVEEEIKNLKYLVFDDYGLIKPVKDAVDEVLTMNPDNMSIAARIGHEPGHAFVGNRILKDSEGLIVKVNL